MKAAIVGIAGPDLLPQEAALFHALPPAGVILFGRNIQAPAQLAGLIAALRDVLAPDADIMVDQEGGRVARLRPPHWQAHPSAASIGASPDPECAAWLSGALIGAQCEAAGFTIVAAPVLDISVPDTSDVVGDRAFAQDPAKVARIGRAMAEGLMAGGVMPVGKHCPGHGRSLVDSHLALPRVTESDLDADIQPFALNADLPWMMTAHIVYDAFDPDRPATLSPMVIDTVIRGRIGFKGVLVTDDLAMNALSGAPADRAVAALAAGCDIALYCQGDFGPTQALLRAVPSLTPSATQRLEAARSLLAPKRQALNVAALTTERVGLLA
jgi:beta-N-acetylhexosaminidase